MCYNSHWKEFSYQLRALAKLIEFAQIISVFVDISFLSPLVVLVVVVAAVDVKVELVVALATSSEQRGGCNLHVDEPFFVVALLLFQTRIIISTFVIKSTFSLCDPTSLSHSNNKALVLFAKASKSLIVIFSADFPESFIASITSTKKLSQLINWMDQ